MVLRAAVAGGSGYAGGELLRLLLGHPELAPSVVAAGQQAGRTVGEVHPGLTPLADQVMVSAEPTVLAEADLVFLALPHGESAALASQLPAGLPAVDLGADHRLADRQAWEAYYGSGHAGTWVYGLPELGNLRSEIALSTRVANPGCFPTAVGLGGAPLLAAGLVEPGDVVVVAASGTSGAGRSPSASLAASEVMGSASAYRVGGTHQHTPEMEQALSEAAGAAVTVSFTPVLAPMSRGLLATVSARLVPGVEVEQLREAVHAAYAKEPFVHLLPEGRWPRTADVAGSNGAHVQVAADHHAGRAVVVVAIDNLGKGAAGQALQNANLVLGLSETAGLTDVGVAP
jgi:N-acetyl-gamma-glutamyl-phosphate reductase